MDTPGFVTPNVAWQAIRFQPIAVLGLGPRGSTHDLACEILTLPTKARITLVHISHSLNSFKGAI